MAELANDEMDELEEQYGLLSWAKQHILLPKGGRLDFDRHPYQRLIYEDLAVESCALKGAQLGFTTKAIAKALWMCVVLGRNGGYSFPTSQDVSKFTQARINPIIRSSAYLSDRILEIDNVYVKQFSGRTRAEREQIEERAAIAVARGDVAQAERLRASQAIATLYFQGTGLGTMTSQARKGEREAMAADLDFLENDEVDRSELRILEQLTARMDHSDLRWRDWLSTPKYPNGPIDRQWARSDQHVWMVPCPACGTWQELRFPGQPVLAGEEQYHNIEPLPEQWQPGMPVRFVCRRARCRATLTDQVRLDGMWVPLRPDSGLIRGWRISQMSYIGKSALDIMTAHAQYSDETDFWNLVMAVPYAGLTDNLSAELVSAAQHAPLGGYRMTWDDPAPVAHTMGVDVGAELHVVIRRPHPVLPGRRATVWIEKVSAGARDPRGWDRLSALMYHWNVGTCVIDAHPEDALTKAWADMHLGRVFRASNLHPTALQHVVWDPPMDEIESLSGPNADYTVKFQRTSLLDQARDRFSKGQIGMPAENDAVTEFKKHCQAMYRVAKHAVNSLGSDTPVVTGYDWVSNGADHYRLADTYELLAASRVNPLTIAGPGATTTILGAKTRQPD